MNLSVSRVHHKNKSSRSITFIPGLVQGGELVTVRATDTIKSMLKYFTHRPIAQRATRKVKALQIQHPSGLGIIFPEVRRRFKEGLFDVE